jgi:lysophospholipase L1-like esterase
MLKWAMIGLGLCFVLLVCAGYVKRANWIEDKIAALSAPASLVYAADNAALSPKGSKPRVVLIGDSRIAQWPGAVLSSTFEIINRGIGGETAAQLTQRFNADAIALEPDVIVIQAGVNDLVAASLMVPDKGREVARKTAETLRQLAGRGAAGDRRVLISTVIAPAKPDLFRRPVWSGSLSDLVADVNADLKATRWPDGASLIDLSSALVINDGKTLAEEFRYDTLHLNTAGYQRLTELLMPRLQSALDTEPRNRTK